MNQQTTAIDASVLGSVDLLSNILQFAVSSTKEVPSISLTSRHWNDVLNIQPESSRSLWRGIAAAQQPEIIRIFHLCEESTLCPNIPGGGWKVLLKRSILSCFKPQGCNQMLQRSFELVFKNEGITAFSNCCGNCTDSYESCCAFKSRAKGITFFKFFLNGMNYEGGDVVKAFVSYTDLSYLLENWEAECDIIRRWCAVLEVEEYIIEKPVLESSCIVIRFSQPVTLEEYQFESDDDFIDEDFDEDMEDETDYHNDVHEREDIDDDDMLLESI